MLIAYCAAVSPTATTPFARHDAVRPDGEDPRVNDYDGAHVGYDDPANPLVASREGADRAYDGALELLARHEVGGGVIYGAVEPMTAAEGAEALAPRASSLFH